MVPLLITGIKIAGAMAGAGMGAELVGGAVRKVAPPRIAGIVGGAVDTIGAVADPFNLAGRTKEIGGNVFGDLISYASDPLDLSGKRKEAKESKKLAEQEKTKAEAAQKAAKAAKKKAAAAKKKSEKLEQKVAALQAQGKEKEAQHAAQLAEQQKTWADMTNKFATKAEEIAKTNGDKAIRLAQVALDTAQKAVQPPQTAADAMTDDMSDEAKALVTRMVDAVNRFGGDESESADDLGEAMLDDGFMVSGPVKKSVVAGCCASCSKGGPCSGAAIPDDMVNGPDDLFAEIGGSFVNAGDEDLSTILGDADEDDNFVFASDLDDDDDVDFVF